MELYCKKSYKEFKKGKKYIVNNEDILKMENYDIYIINEHLFSTKERMHNYLHEYFCNKVEQRRKKNKTNI
jgi:hypothetical protein